MTDTWTLPYMTAILPVEKDRAFEDILVSERRLRGSAEGSARDLHKLLLDLAVRLDGARLEEMRRQDPTVPGSWTTSNWREFFATVQTQAPGWIDAQAVQRERETLLQQIDGLRVELASRKKVQLLPRPELEQESTQPSEPAPQPVLLTDLPADFTPPLTGLLADARNASLSFPKTCPAAFRKVLNGNGRTGGDLAKVYQRYWIALYLVGRWQISSMFEIDDVQATLAGLSASSGSLRRVLDNLIEANFLVTEKLVLNSPKSSLKLVRLTADGLRLYKTLFGLDPAETDWERLIRLHEGERFPEHTLAVLIFALHARKRGWGTQVLPQVESINAVPDLAVRRGDQTLYVEVELSKKESPTKWRNQADLNSGKVALCAATPEGRKRLVGDCRLAHLLGLATDLETLVKVKFQTIDETTPLWLEEW